MLELAIVSFVAGILTVLAPCILPLLPVVIGGSALHGGQTDLKKLSIKHPLIITASLAVSIIIFTLLLKATTTLLGVPTHVWNVISGGIVLAFGINLLVPSLWERFMIATGWQAGANRLAAGSQAQKGIWSSVLLGFSLGPVFNSCSPTYALIVAVLLPASFASGMLYLLMYVLGLSAVLLLLGIFGQTLSAKLRWLANPSGWFRRVVGILFVVVGVALVFGLEKVIQTAVLEQGWYEWVEVVERGLR